MKTKSLRSFYFLLPALLLVSCTSRQNPLEKEGSPQQASSQKTDERPFGLLIHGGAGRYSRDFFNDQRKKHWKAQLNKARDVGYAVLEKGGTSLDAVQAAVEVLEQDTLFNAGKGAVMNREGHHQLDASIMEGHRRRAGAVACVAHIAAPIKAARWVMDSTRHVLLAGSDADAWAAKTGLTHVPNAYFTTVRTKRHWQQRYGKSHSPGSLPKSKGTVGAVALDQDGHLAAATSTGGMTGKLPGRVGDSPLIGSGTYASKRVAVSATGSGEYYIRGALAYDVHARVCYRDQALEAAARTVIHQNLHQMGGKGGLIALDSAGNITAPFNTGGMLRSYCFSDGRANALLYQDD